MSFSQITVTGTYELPNAGIALGSVTFQPSTTMANGGVMIADAPVSVTLDAAGHFSVQLWANDDSGTTPAGTFYVVVEEIGTETRTYNVVIPHASTPVDISTLAHI